FFYVWNKPKKSVAATTPDYSINTSQFAFDFLKDTAAADKKYADKVLVLSGVIDEIETDATGLINLVFAEDSLDIQCALDSASSIKARTLKLQDSVKLKGNYIGYLHDDIFGLQVKLNDCVTE
ncbi:MAG: OB-fold protein, partial [Bacteroidia bacterium]